MPFNTAPDDVTLAQMRAEMLRRFDDGASLLGQDPNMLQVGLFGRAPKKAPAPPVNLSRRSAMGLPEMPIPMAGESKGQLVPQRNDIPPPSSLPPPPAAPQQQAMPQPQAPANPLGQLVNKALNEPVTRRQVLQRAGSAALQQVLPTPKVADVVAPVVQQVASPLVEAATTPDVMPNAYMTALGLLKDAIHWDFYSNPVDKKISELEKYRAIADSAKIPQERLTEIDELLRQAKEAIAIPYEPYAKLKRNEITQDEFKREISKRDELGKTLNGIVGDLIEAAPADAFIQHVYTPSKDWEVFDALTRSDMGIKEIKKLLKTLKMPYDPEEFKAWQHGSHF